MKKAKIIVNRSLRFLIGYIFIIIILESNMSFTTFIRACVVYVLPFLSGRRGQISNMFIGMIVSTLVALVGFVSEYLYEKKKTRKSIVEMYIKIEKTYFQDLGYEDAETIKMRTFSSDMEKIDKLHDEYELYLPLKKKGFIRLLWFLGTIYNYYLKRHQLLIYIKAGSKDKETSVDKYEKFRMEYTPERISQLDNSVKSLLSLTEKQLKNQIEIAESITKEGQENEKILCDEIIKWKESLMSDDNEFYEIVEKILKKYPRIALKVYSEKAVSVFK